MFTDNPEASFKNDGVVSVHNLINDSLWAETQRINAGKTIDVAALDAPIAVILENPMNEASRIFHNRYNHYRTANWSEFGGKFETLPASLFKIDFVNGSVMAGLCDEVEFILITSKIGKFMMYRRADGVIHYITEEQFSICHSAKNAGFGNTTGIIATEQQINHIFAIPDSYR